MMGDGVLAGVSREEMVAGAMMRDGVVAAIGSM